MEFTRSNDIRYRGFTPDAIRVLKRHDWPGNVRELKHFIRKNYTLLSNGDTLFHDFPIGSYNDPVIISGVNSDTLKIENIPYSMDGYVYNLEMITRGFACDDNVYTNSSTLKVFLLTLTTIKLLINLI